MNVTIKLTREEYILIDMALKDARANKTNSMIKDLHQEEDLQNLIETFRLMNRIVKFEEEN